MMGRRGLARRAAIERRILGLRPCMGAIEERLARLRTPRVTLGPTFLDGARFPDGRERIRRGAIWFVDGVRTGFHVDFLSDGVLIEAYSSERRMCLELTGKITPEGLRRELGLVLGGAGLLRQVRLDDAHRQVNPAATEPPTTPPGEPS